MAKFLQYKYLYVLCTGILLSFVLVSCSKDGSSDEGELFIKVLDAPAAYEEINIVVDRVSIHQLGAASDMWTNVSAGGSVSFDLLNLRNGRNLQLVLNKVPIGNYDQIKINYGQCTITNNGIPYPLDQASLFNGDVLDYGFTITEGDQMQLTFDFDAGRSIYTPDGWQYFFRPSIRVQNTLLSGWITGSVLDSGKVVVSATIKTFTGLDSVSTFNEPPYGSFQLSDLPEGESYTIAIVPDDPWLATDTLHDVIVERQKGTHLGAIHLQYK